MRMVVAMGLHKRGRRFQVRSRILTNDTGHACDRMPARHVATPGRSSGTAYLDLQRNTMSAYLGGTSTNEAPVRKAVTLPSLLAMRASGEKIAMLTCYDASFASLMDRCGVDILLIGDRSEERRVGKECRARRSAEQ